MFSIDFDKAEKRFFGGFIFIWAISLIASLSLIGAIIWGIVKLVTHFTGGA